jgi:mono/diheme cytochrome c family protein
MSINTSKHGLFGGAILTVSAAFFFAVSSAPRAASQPMAAGDAAKGKTVFEDNCAFCHNADSNEANIGPGLKDLFKWPPHKLSDGTEHKEHTVEIIKNQVVNGGGGMGPMGDKVQGADLDNLLAYLQTL